MGNAQTSVAMQALGWWYEQLDVLRRLHGYAFDSVGLGPDKLACRTVLALPSLRLRHYGTGRGGGPVLLIVPAPIKRYYIWDMSAQHSVVRQALARGLDVYLIEWTEPEANNGLAAYIAQLLDPCMEVIARRTRRPVFLAGHSLGGTLAGLFAAYRPERVAGLVLIEAPLHFADAAGAFHRLLDSGVPARAVLPDSDFLPGSLLSLIGISAAPETFLLDRYLDFLRSLANPDELETHWRVVRWTLDELPLPRRLFDDVVQQLYRDDRFMRGDLHIGGRRIGPHDIDAPMFIVYEPQSQIIPAPAIIAFHHAAGSLRKILVPYHGDSGIAIRHVGALVGSRAHREIWPRAFSWMYRQ